MLSYEKAPMLIKCFCTISYKLISLWPFLGHSKWDNKQATFIKINCKKNSHAKEIKLYLSTFTKTEDYDMILIMIYSFLLASKETNYHKQSLCNIEFPPFNTHYQQMHVQTCTFFFQIPPSHKHRHQAPPGTQTYTPGRDADTLPYTSTRPAETDTHTLP